nr:immunoglobulin heavy chain junction region [Macaca mulatta]
CARVQSNLDYW